MEMKCYMKMPLISNRKRDYDTKYLLDTGCIHGFQTLVHFEKQFTA